MSTVHPKDVGDRSTLAVILALQAKGAQVYIPFGENTRCDLIADDGSRLERIQCKTGRLSDGKIAFRTSSTYAHHPNPKIHSRPYHGEIDAFGVYCPELGTVYLVPIADLPNRCGASLRIDPPRNSQVRRIRLAAAYEVGCVLISPSATTREPAGPAGG
jgi:hypothetical protein